MPITFSCPSCNRNLKAKEHHAGRTSPCPACNTPVTVPTTPYQSSFKDIFDASRDGTVEDVKYFIEKKGIDVKAKDNDGRTLLHVAALGNPNVEVLKYLVSRGTDVKAKNQYGGTPLHAAAGSSSCVKILKYLVSQGIDVDVKDDDDWTPLFYAAQRNSKVEVLEYLVSLGSNVKARDKRQGQTPLHLAAQKNPNVEVLKYLVSQGADIYAEDNDGNIPLHNAAFRNPEVVVLDYLVSVSKYVSVDKKNATAMSPLHLAAVGNSNVEVLEYLVRRGATIKMPCEGGFTPLGAAIFMNPNPNMNVVEYLVSQGANIHEKNDDGLTLLHLAAANIASVDVLKCLISRGANINEKHERGGFTPLHLAARGNPNVEVLRCLIDQGAKVDGKDNSNLTPLHEAAEHNPKVDVLKCLISRGADVNARDVFGRTPLDIADTEEKKRILREAMAERAVSTGEVPAAPSGTQSTEEDRWANYRPHTSNVFHAVSNFPLEEVKYWIEKEGHSVNAKDGDGWSLLHLAALLNSHVEVLEYLISRGADVNATAWSVDNRCYRTPLDVTTSSFVVGREEKRRILREALRSQSLFGMIKRRSFDIIREGMWMWAYGSWRNIFLGMARKEGYVKAAMWFLFVMLPLGFLPYTVWHILLLCYNLMRCLFMVIDEHKKGK